MAEQLLAVAECKKFSQWVFRSVLRSGGQGCFLSTVPFWVPRKKLNRIITPLTEILPFGSHDCSIFPRLRQGKIERSGDHLRCSIFNHSTGSSQYLYKSSPNEKMQFIIGDILVFLLSPEAGYQPIVQWFKAIDSLFNWKSIPGTFLAFAVSKTFISILAKL